MACPDCGHAIDEPTAYTATRSLYACKRCPFTEWRGTEPTAETHDKSDLRTRALFAELDTLIPTEAVNASPPNRYLDGDHPARRLRSRLLVQKRIAKAARKNADPQVRVRALADLADVRPKLRDAEEAVPDKESQRWHDDALAGTDPQVFWAMVGDHEYHGRRKRVLAPSRDRDCEGARGDVWEGLGTPAASIRDFLANNPWHHPWEYQRTGNPNGRPPKPAPAENELAPVIEWIEAAVGEPIVEVCKSVGRGKRSPTRKALEDAVSRSTTHTNRLLAAALKCDPRTPARWRRNCPLNTSREGDDVLGLAA